MVATGVLALPGLAGATSSHDDVEKVELGPDNSLHLSGKCEFDHKPGRVIGVIGLLHKKVTERSSFSAWADADKDGSFGVDVKVSHELTSEETHVAGVLCVSKEDHHKHKVVKESMRCLRPTHPTPPSTRPATTVKPPTSEKATTTTEETSDHDMTTTTTEKPGAEETPTPTPTEVEKVVERETVPKAETLPAAVTASPKFTG
jgi:hypothetical protein